MSQETLTELEMGIDSEVLEAIDETIETEQGYEDYVSEERARREREKKRKRKEQLKKEQQKRQEENEKYKNSAKKELHEEINSDVEDPKLTEYTRRVHKVKKHKYEKKFIITVTDKYGETTSDRVEMGLPEDKSSEWVRICEQAGVDPSKPTDLRGEIIPMKIKNPENIDIPPINAGFNPIRYKIGRTSKKITSKPKVKKLGEYIEKSFPWWGTVLGFSVGGAIFTLLSTIELHTLILPFYAIGVVTTAMLIATSVVYGIKYWGMLLLASIFITIMKTFEFLEPRMKKVYRYAFPKTET